MKKIKILEKGFNTASYGYFQPDTEQTVDDGLADYCVLKMKSAVYCQAAKPVKKPVKK